MKSHMTILLWGIFCVCIGIDAGATEIFFDTNCVSHTFNGMGTQIWSGDTAVRPLLEALNIQYIRMEATPNWAAVSQSPPTDGQRASFDQYVSANYGSARLNNMKTTAAMLSQLGIQAVFNQFHYPSEWRNFFGTLRTENHQDVALLWGAQLTYLRANGVEADFIEIFNEPEGTWNCRVPPAQYNDVVKRVRQELDARGFTQVQIVGPGLAYLDYNDGGSQWVGALDAAALDALGAFSTHAWDEKFYPNCGPERLRLQWAPFGAAVLEKDPARQKPIFVTEYMTGNYVFHGVAYANPDSTYAASASDTLPFAIRVFEHTLSLLNLGVSTPFLWEAADQSWSDSGWGLQRRAADGSTKRPVYHAVKILTDSVPPGAEVLTAPPQNNNDLYLAAFRYDGGFVLATVNGTAAAKTKTVAFSGAADMEFIIARSYSGSGSGFGENMFSIDSNNQIALNLPSDSALTILFESSANMAQKALEWKFEGAVNDTSGNGNHATTAAGGISFVRGKFGQALAFDGTEAWVELVGGAGLPLAADDDWSMNLWVYTDLNISSGPSYHALALAAMGTNSWSENGNARSIGNWGWGGGISFYSTTLYPTQSKVPYEVGRWQMITLTYEHALWQEQGSDSSGESLKIYKDGSRIASFNPQGRYYTGGLRAADNVVSLLPTIPDQASSRFVGKLDEFTIWQGVLSPARISAMAAQAPVAGDLTGDRQINLDDLACFCGYWLSEDPDCVADLDDSRRVDMADFAVWAESLNE